MDFHDRCTIYDEGTRCKGTTFITVKVQVFHPDTLRHSWQTWHFCEEHFMAFKQSHGIGWFCSYHGKKARADSPVVDFKVIG